MEREDQRARLPDAARRARARTDPGGPLLDVALALATGAAAAASLLDASLRHPALGLGLCGVPLVTRVAWFPAVRHRARGIGLAVLAGVALAAGRTSPSPSRDAQGWSPRASVLPGDGHAPVSLAPDGLGERHRARSSHDRAGGFPGEVAVSLRVDPGALATAAGSARCRSRSTTLPSLVPRASGSRSAPPRPKAWGRLSSSGRPTPCRGAFASDSREPERATCWRCPACTSDSWRRGSRSPSPVPAAGGGGRRSGSAWPAWCSSPRRPWGDAEPRSSARP